MRKKYLSPSVSVVHIVSSTQLLAASNGVNFDVNGNDEEVTDGGTTDPDEDYNPW